MCKTKRMTGDLSSQLEEGWTLTVVDTFTHLLCLKPRTSIVHHVLTCIMRKI